MKKYMIRLFILLIGLSASMVSCIDDETTGFVREISEITITSVSGEGVSEDGEEVNVTFMTPTHITAQVEQTLEGYDLKYEWKAGFFKEYEKGKPKVDSMPCIGEDPVLNYTFDRVGSYWLRLRVYNEHGSAFYYMIVNVRAGMERGLLVLSSDETQQSFLSFCPVVQAESELLDATAEDFDTDVWSRINPEEEALLDVRDMVITKINKSVALLSKAKKCIYELESNTLMLLRKMNLTIAMDWNVVPISMFVYDNTWNGGVEYLYVLSENGIVTRSQLEYSGMLQEYFGTTMKCSKMIPLHYNSRWGGTYDYAFGIDNENEKIENYGVTDSKNDFQGQEIVNLGFANATPYAVSRSKAQPDLLRVTIYEKMEDNSKNSNDQLTPSSKYEYTLTAPLTLTLETTLIYNDTYHAFFYHNGNKIYRWRTTAQELPYENDARNTAIVPTGEITCMAQSADNEYLYVGVYDEAAAGLKGNVYIYKTETLELVKSFIGVANKPVKLFYKDIK